ncbi:MAG TPA: CDP-alcohol phosphatidyltransferase family protein [Candidatus Saccharimonadales bacterium]|nr:CDP-alcohol phosphatidyltransferase family protein [Candidatus Saccharimonadales bacterium]
MSHGHLAFLIVAASLLILDIRAQRWYTRGVRGAMESTAESSWIPDWLNPNYLTVSGVAMCIVTAPLAYFKHADSGWVILGIALFLVGSLLDVLDGSVARQLGKTTPFGKFLDSNTDRMGECAVFIALGMLLYQQRNAGGVLAAFLAIVGSFLVSYARATTELAQVKATVKKKTDFGLARRAERCTAIIAILLWMAIGWSWTPWLYLITALVWLTVAQRWIEAYGINGKSAE